MPQFNGKQDAKPSVDGQANLRCPRNGKRTNFLTEIPPHHRSHWARLKQRAWEGDGSVPPARIPANTVAAPLRNGTALTPTVLAGKPVRVLNVSVHHEITFRRHACSRAVPGIRRRIPIVFGANRP